MLKFTIITPNYNQGSFLLNNLESVDSQNYDDIEHVVIDGGSTDNSVSVLNSFDPVKPLFWISEPDSGQSEAINKGFRVASGDIVAWLNADDFYASNESLTVVAKVFDERPEIDVVYGRGAYIQLPDKEKKEAWIQSEPSKLKYTLAGSVGIIQPSVFFRKEILTDSGILNEENQSCMDYEFWMQLVFSGASFHFLDEDLSCAILHQDAKSVAQREIQILDSLKASLKFFNFAHPRWITAYAEAKILGASSFLENFSKEDLDKARLNELETMQNELWKKYNFSNRAITQLLSGHYLDRDEAEKGLSKHLPDWEKLTETSKIKQVLPRGKNIDLTLFPVFESMEDLRDQIHRLAWYIPSASEISCRLLISTSLEEKTRLEKRSLLSGMENNISVVSLEPGSQKTQALLSQSRTIGIWKNFEAIENQISDLEDIRIFNLDKNNKSRREAFSYGVLLHELSWSLRKSMTEEMPWKLQAKIKSLPSYEKSYLFCTGPSLSDAIRHDFSDGYRIVCNSLISNKKLMDHIKPHFVVAADPVFHFGASKYASSFRRSLVTAILDYDLTFLLPFFFYPNFASQFPFLNASSIGVHQDPNTDYRFDLQQQLLVRGSDNILTILMIPLGATLSKDLYILGCDGRKPDENYFWKHDKASQFSDLMQEARNFHPGFFDHCDYADYYDHHCDNLSNMIKAGEEQGIKFNSFTHSYIPCLAERSV